MASTRSRTWRSHSSIEGCEARRSSSKRRYSCIDCRFCAARSASSSRTSWDTFLIVICTMQAFCQQCQRSASTYRAGYSAATSSQGALTSFECRSAISSPSASSSCLREHRLRGLEQLPLFPPDVIVKRRAELAKRLTPLGVSGCILHARHQPVHRQVVAVEPLDLGVVDRAVPDQPCKQALALRVEVRQQPP